MRKLRDDKEERGEEPIIRVTFALDVLTEDTGEESFTINLETAKRLHAELSKFLKGLGEI